VAKLYPTNVPIDLSSIPIHPEVEKRIKKWERIEILLDQDEEKITENFCRMLPNEDPKSYDIRKETYNETFVNITQDLITAPVNSVFSQGLKIDYKNENSSIVKKMNENVTIGSENITIRRYIKDFVGVAIRGYGSVCTIIDKPKNASESLAVEINDGLPYISNIQLKDIKNWSLDYEGNLNWIVYTKNYLPAWENPFTEKAPISIELECMYTKNEYIVRKAGGKVINELSMVHNYGFVPVVIQGSFLAKQGDILGNAAMFQTSNSIINMNNNLNVGNYELYKHGGALLLMPEDATSGTNLETDEKGNVNLKKHDDNGMLVYGGDIQPDYLLKELKVADFMAWAMAYQRYAIENERDLKSIANKGTSGEIVQESGFAKMVDREPLESNLISLSEDFEAWYQKVTAMRAKLMNVEDDSSIEFDKDYDLRSTKQKYEELKIAIENDVRAVSPTLFREHYKNIAPGEVRDPDILSTINNEIDEYNPDLINDEIAKEIEEQQKESEKEKE